MPSFSHMQIPRSILEEMLGHARNALPAEGCGFLAGNITGENAVVSHFHSLVNELSSRVEFATEPRSVFAAYKAMRANGTDLLALYHSHPTAPAIPSRRDLARNTYGMSCAWLIIGLMQQEPDIRLWWLDDTAFQPVEWSIVEK